VSTENLGATDVHHHLLPSAVPIGNVKRLEHALLVSHADQGFNIGVLLHQLIYFINPDEFVRMVLQVSDDSTVVRVNDELSFTKHLDNFGGVGLGARELSGESKIENATTW